MQRIRMSLPYFREYNWAAEVVYVNPKYIDISTDPLLNESVPEYIKTYPVKAFSKKWTSKLGLGSIALRSLFFYKKKVNDLLRENRFDLIYFSTTQFPICTLGAYWNQKFGVPYIIDMQDPWHSEYYMSKPKNERPPKYWFSYRLNKYLEPFAMTKVDGLISVSDAYIQTLKERYPELKDKPTSTITFGAFRKDSEIVKKQLSELKLAFQKDNGKLNLVYIGRGGKDMHKALALLFNAFRKGIKEAPDLFNLFRMHFIGTSYAAKGQGKPSIAPLAEEFGLEAVVTEQTDRVPFYQGLASLQHADGLIVPGSDDPAYTASKLYPYILVEKPILGLFHKESSAVKIIEECNAGDMITFGVPEKIVYNKVKDFLKSVVEEKKPHTNWSAFEPYTAKEMTRRQCELFEEVLKRRIKN